MVENKRINTLVISTPHTLAAEERNEFLLRVSSPSSYLVYHVYIIVHTLRQLEFYH